MAEPSSPPTLLSDMGLDPERARGSLIGAALGLWLGLVLGAQLDLVPWLQSLFCCADAATLAQWAAPIAPLVGLLEGSVLGCALGSEGIDRRRAAFGAVCGALLGLGFPIAAPMALAGATLDPWGMAITAVAGALSVGSVRGDTALAAGLGLLGGQLVGLGLVALLFTTFFSNTSVLLPLATIALCAGLAAAVLRERRQAHWTQLDRIRTAPEPRTVDPEVLVLRRAPGPSAPTELRAP